MKLGDAIGKALSSVGITDERVSRALGVKDCGCKKRREKLNQVGFNISRLTSYYLSGFYSRVASFVAFVPLFVLHNLACFFRSMERRCLDGIHWLNRPQRR